MTVLFDLARNAKNRVQNTYSWAETVLTWNMLLSMAYNT